jgi:hypothetical protein
MDKLLVAAIDPQIPKLGPVVTKVGGLPRRGAAAVAVDTARATTVKKFLKLSEDTTLVHAAEGPGDSMFLFTGSGTYLLDLVANTCIHYSGGGYPGKCWVKGDYFCTGRTIYNYVTDEVLFSFTGGYTPVATMDDVGRIHIAARENSTYGFYASYNMSNGSLYSSARLFRNSDYPTPSGIAVNSAGTKLVMTVTSISAYKSSIIAADIIAGANNTVSTGYAANGEDYKVDANPKFDQYGNIHVFENVSSLQILTSNTDIQLSKTIFGITVVYGSIELDTDNHIGYISGYNNSQDDHFIAKYSYNSAGDVTVLSRTTFHTEGSFDAADQNACSVALLKDKEIIAVNGRMSFDASDTSFPDYAGFYLGMSSIPSTDNGNSTTYDASDTILLTSGAAPDTPIFKGGYTVTKTDITDPYPITVFSDLSSIS